MARSALRAADTERQVHLYYPAEGFGCMYHRTMLNEFFTKLVHGSKIQTVAEAPLDSYGMVGVGSLIFAQLGCKLTLISDDPKLLERGLALMRFNHLGDVQLLRTPIDEIPLPSNSFDFTWSYERIQAQSNPLAVLAELCRVSKAIMVVVPNGFNYGQLAHRAYHGLSGGRCDYAGPMRFMKRQPIREALKRRGMLLIDDGLIDIPWWPLFPELPNLVRRLIGKAPVIVEPENEPERNPVVVPERDVLRLRQQIRRAAVIEQSGYIPGAVKLLFAHSAYVVACKPEYRHIIKL